MVWKVDVQPKAEEDLALIFDYLIGVYQEFGDAPEEAFERAAGRVRSIRDAAIDLGRQPHMGTKRPELGSEIRNVTINRAVIWFRLDPENEMVQVLAFFFGSQDHYRYMLRRLLSD